MLPRHICSAQGSSIESTLNGHEQSRPEVAHRGSRIFLPRAQPAKASAS